MRSNQKTFPPPEQAFILGAGLGTRLRPLTDELPKPLIPLWNKPLISYALDHVMADLGVSEFMVNTHHLPECYDRAFPDGKYGGSQLSFRKEPVLLDTGGGIENVRDWLRPDQSFIVYNGDILTDLPLERAWQSHLENGNIATLILRSSGSELRVGWDEDSGKVVDLRGRIDPDWPHRFQFTGIYLISPEFWPFLEPNKIESVVLGFLRAIRGGARVGGVVIDEGQWSDVGERQSYLETSFMLAEEKFPSYGRSSGMRRIHPDAEMSGAAKIDGTSTVGAGAVIGENAVVTRSIIWDGAMVAPDARIEGCIVRTGQRASGECLNRDF